MRELLHHGLQGGADSVAVVAASTHGPANGLAYAGINGTIIAIAFAGILGYAFVVFESLEKMREELVAAANATRRRGFIAVMNDSGVAIEHLSLKELYALIRELPEHLPVRVGDSVDAVTIAPDELFRRGRLFVVVAEHVFIKEPYFQNEGLSDESAVRSWLPSLGASATALRQVFDTVKRFDFEIIDAADSRLDADALITFPPGTLPKAVIAEMTGGRLRRAFDAMDAWIDQVLERHALMELQAERISKYRNRNVPTGRTGAAKPFVRLASV